MPLWVNLQHLSRDDLALKGGLPVEELDLGVNDEMVRPRSTLQYDLRVEKLDQSVLAQGCLKLTLDCQCVRCLKPLVEEVCLEQWACLLPLKGEEPVPVVNDCVDLTPSIREDILLGFPQHPVCKPECGGLPGRAAGKPGDAGGVGSALPSSPSWSELDKLKL